MKHLLPLLFLASTATAQLQGEWQGTFPEGAQYRFAFTDDAFTMTILAEVPTEVLKVTLETIVRGSYTATEDSLSLVPDGPPEILVDGVDVETFIRQQFEEAGLEAPSDSVVTEIAGEFLGDPLPDYGPVTFGYVLEGDLLRLSTDTGELVLRRVPAMTAVETTSWGRIKRRR